MQKLCCSKESLIASSARLKHLDIAPMGSTRSSFWSMRSRPSLNGGAIGACNCRATLIWRFETSSMTNCKIREGLDDNVLAVLFLLSWDQKKAIPREKRARAMNRIGRLTPGTEKMSDV